MSKIELSSRGRSIALLVVGILIGALMVAPASAHFVPKLSHIKKHLRKTFFTKNQTKNRFVQNGSPAGGDLGGSYPDPEITDEAVDSAAIGDGQVLAPDLGSIVEHSSPGVSVAPGTIALAGVSCAPGEQVISGGAFWTNSNVNGPIVRSFLAGNGWIVRARNNTSQTHTLVAEVYCLAA